ncbi:recombinase family protein [Desulfosporosinus lacus]|uniref:Recombinase n=1 Tax=Desulfosporosinus lacus DSM 15449 TaxID=1121420 RepID=A0A1M5WGB6_9FIRM|nr:recombinase family protein [Desulfosporosinus lacus]SHH86448.1 Recombinase [Desulfosporosinus lacus DSM 15449]
MRVTKEQKLIALDLVISQGKTVSEVAKKFGVTKQSMFQHLKKFPEYNEFHERKRIKGIEDRKNVLAMGREGYSQTVIARELGLAPMTVRAWLLEDGIDATLKGNDDLTCPACNGVMKKQDMFFWQCNSCGSEWWPKEAPADTDDWTRPWRIRYGDGGKEMLGIATRMRSEGYSSEEICKVLNDQGIKTPRGEEWTKQNLSQQFRRRGIVSRGGDRAKIEAVTRTLVEKGVYLKDIAIRLNSEGLMNEHGNKWTKSGISLLCQRMGIEVKRRKKISLKSDCVIHPWVADETARLEKNRAWRRSHDVPSL